MGLQSILLILNIKISLSERTSLLFTPSLPSLATNLNFVLTVSSNHLNHFIFLVHQPLSDFTFLPNLDCETIMSLFNGLLSDTVKSLTHLTLAICILIKPNAE